METKHFLFPETAMGVVWNYLRESWYPSARFIVPFMSICTQYESTNTSSAILSYLQYYQVSNAAVLFLKSNTEVTICYKTLQIQHLARTWNWTPGILMRMQTESLQLTALCLWRCSQCDSLLTSGKKTYLKRFITKMFDKCSISVRALTAPTSCESA